MNKTKPEIKNEEEDRKTTPVRRIPFTFGFRPLKTIFVLLLIILILALLLFFFGLGGGGGKPLPGSSTSPSLSNETPAEKKTPVELKGKPSVRRELNIVFPHVEETDELTCNLSWTDPTTGSRENRRIAEDNMPDFEFALEKSIRAWYAMSPVTENRDVPIIAVGMIPFPGEGVLRKIEKIARDVDTRISILRLETK